MAMAPYSLLLLATASSAAPGLSAGVSGLLSNVFASNMVLQHGRPAPLWGWAAPGANVAVTFGTHSLPVTEAGADGLWKAHLPAQPPSLKAHTIGVASGAHKTALTNVLFGDVILCSGRECFTATTRVVSIAPLSCH